MSLKTFLKLTLQGLMATSFKNLVREHLSLLTLRNQRKSHLRNLTSSREGKVKCFKYKELQQERSFSGDLPVRHSTGCCMNITTSASFSVSPSPPAHAQAAIIPHLEDGESSLTLSLPNSCPLQGQCWVIAKFHFAVSFLDIQ